MTDTGHISQKIQHKSTNSRAILSSVLGTSVMLAGCTDPAKYQELRQSASSGVTVEINPTDAETWSKNQLAYLEHFAAPEALPTTRILDSRWAEITRFGFSFIDQECETYFGALHAYSLQQGSLRTSTGLVGTASATLLALANAATTAIAAVGGAFTLAQGLMDTSAQTVLFSLPPTELRDLRQKAAQAYRVAYFGDATSGEGPKIQIDTRSEAVEAIGGYAATCTPVVLRGLVGSTLNQVTLQRDASTGRIEVTGFQSTGLDRQVKAEDPANESIVRLPLPRSPALERVFSGPGWTNDRLRTLQAAFCVAEADRGNVGPVTIGNVNMAITGSELDPASNKSRIGDAEYARILAATGGGICNTGHYKNYFENSNFRSAPAEEAGLLKEMQNLFSDGPISPPSSFAEPAARTLIARARTRCGLPNDPRHPFVDQVTPDLDTKLANAECGGQ